MIIVDTSVWIDHFRRPLPRMTDLLARGEVLQHLYVTCELALGNWPDRPALVAYLDTLTPASVCSEAELLTQIEECALGGSGLGFVDAHLVASAVAMQCSLWASDKRLRSTAESLDLAYSPD